MAKPMLYRGWLTRSDRQQQKSGDTQGASMSDIPTDRAPQGGIDFGALAHAIAGISAVVLGGLMYTRPWARDVFSILMIAAAVSAVSFSWKHSAWATDHWVAMVPVTGVTLRYVGWQ